MRSITASCIRHGTERSDCMKQGKQQQALAQHVPLAQQPSLEKPRLLLNLRSPQLRSAFATLFGSKTVAGVFPATAFAARQSCSPLHRLLTQAPWRLLRTSVIALAEVLPPNPALRSAAPAAEEGSKHTNSKQLHSSACESTNPCRLRPERRRKRKRAITYAPMIDRDVERLRRLNRLYHGTEAHCISELRMRKAKIGQPDQNTCMDGSDGSDSDDSRDLIDLNCYTQPEDPLGEDSDTLPTPTRHANVDNNSSSTSRGNSKRPKGKKTPPTEKPQNKSRLAESTEEITATMKSL
ncbi:hypothetical protein EJB05_54480, partial [Eragrostis curvula]